MAMQLPEPRYMPCIECGAAVERARRDEHVCERERLLDYRMFHLRADVAAIDDQISAYLDSPRGRFELWSAERDRNDESDG